MAIGFFPQLVEVGNSGGGLYLIAGGITAAGTGYTVTDNLTAVGGIAIQPTIISVDAINGSGGVTTQGGVQIGAYEAPLPSVLTYTGGSGSGFQTNLGGTFVLSDLIPQRLNGGDLGAVFSAMTYSAWHCVAIGGTVEGTFYALDPAHLTDQLFEINARTTGGGGPTSIPVAVDINIPVSTGTGPFTSFYFQGTFTGTVPFYIYTASGVTTKVRILNSLVSFNTLSSEISVYVNNTLLTLDGGSPGWTGSGAITNGAGIAWRQWTKRYPTPTGTATVGVGDVWVDTTHRDLSDTNVRRKWINADLTAVALPTNGQLAGGGSIPIIFLHTTSAGAPNDFIANGGTGSAWLIKNADPNGTNNAAVYALSLFTDLAFEANGACVTVSPPSGGALNMDNIVVTSLLTESPCTAAVFDPVFEATGPSLGLRWSDTRGKTFGNPVPQDFSADPLWQPQWNRTGMARDRVFELFWSAAVKTALNGAFVEVAPLRS